MTTNTLLDRTQFFLSCRGDDLDATQVAELQSLVSQHRELYNATNPIISDKEYDLLYTLLVDAEERLEIQDPKSPTRQVDSAVKNQFEKGTHRHTMASLDNTYNATDLADFEKRIRNILKKQQDLDSRYEDMIEYMVELKFDGLGVALTYTDGKLTRGLTRGNGIEGEDITINLMQVSNIPKTLDTTIKNIEIRGEIIMPISSFQALNESRKKSGEKLFANPRNAASGSVRQKDWKVTASRQLEFYAYSCPDIENLGSVTSYDSLIKKLGSWGFLTTPYFEKQMGIEEVIHSIEALGEKPKYPFEIDGLVIKVNDLALWDILGATAHHPRSAISYKFPAEYERTQILGIEHSVGRTGTITPVADVEPVNIGGAIVRRATLHNYEDMEKKGVKIGDHVWIHRAGEVIPEIIGPITEVRDGLEQEIIIPSHCPVCNAPAVKDGEKVALVCTNPLCPAKITGQLEWFVSKHGLDIDGLGPAQIELFQNKGWIEDMADIFDLKEYETDILQLEGYKERAVSNLLNAIEDSRIQPVWKVIAALGIPGVGKRTAKTLQHLFVTEESLQDFSLSDEQLEAVHDIGPETATNIVSFFDTHHEQIGKLLSKISVTFEPSGANGSQDAIQGVLSGKSFCVTGSFETHSRDDLHEMIEQHGGAVRTSVSRKLDYLVAGEKAGSKLQKAADNDVHVLSLDDFLDFLK